MDTHVKEYFRQASDEGPRGSFYSVIALHESAEISWDWTHSKISNVPRGWYELAQLPSKDRIEFSHDFWLAKLPYRAGVDKFLDRFFGSLDDIGVYITQKKFDDPHEVSLVYCIKGYNGFFRGYPPVNGTALDKLSKAFSPYLLPNDYLAFLQIHDGFSKATDCTGITRSAQMLEKYEAFQSMLQQQDPIITSIGTTVDPKTLIPFYESFGMPFFQCFWTEWYPDQEMGNVYYSTENKSISDVYNGVANSETMAFYTFIDWLMFYLERIV
jgi:hypothetical protein